ncbi:glycosyltransferase family 39 protein [uncultured Pseudodesulfovibrio sp.]|uniref:ArnT family glycosyltransferase n=1 Tax=uncultured Pseudodesulfovibrio sp. TaxID=2035858 RepID=UPI0029C90761|nr:glycosyltransferase family 39 protein [uncultured Pseudodesulfovibrio sp.]
MTETTSRFWGTPFVTLPLFLALTFGVRFSWFYTPTIDWDESTFILFGQHILNGGLPYVDYFDVKPPLLFYFFAGVIKVLGASIPAIRVAGALCVFATASACYFLARYLWDATAGFFAGVLCIAGMSVGGGMATLSETVAMAPLAAWAYLIIVHNRRAWSMFLAGVCMGAAVLIRSNLAYVCLLSAPCILYILLGNRRGCLLRASAYALGGVLVLLLTLYPFYSHDALADLYRAVVMTPLLTMWGAAMSAAGIKALIWSWNDGINFFLVLSFCGVVFCVSQIKAQPAPFGKYCIFLFSILVGVGFSFFGGRTIYAHYILQLVPVLALFGGYLLSRLNQDCSRMRMLCHVLAFYCLLVSLLPLSGTLQRLMGIAHSRDGEFHVLMSDESKAARYIKERLPEGRCIWVMNNHILYWLLSLEPPTKYLIHPSVITSDAQIAVASGHKASATGEIEDVFARRPYFIVRHESSAYLRDETPEVDLINTTMRRNYEKVAQFGPLGVFRISDS